ncbi:unnamed protein product [Ixodes pacificus]
MELPVSWHEHMIASGLSLCKALTKISLTFTNKQYNLKWDHFIQETDTHRRILTLTGV